MRPLTASVRGIGVLGAGLDGWPATRAILAGEVPYVAAPPRNPAPAIMPAAERRRASAAIRVALEVAHQAVTHAGVEAGSLAAVFTSCDGDGDTIHAVCQAITQPGYPVSPTRFTNSVHNAPAGYWSIAVTARAPSTSLCAWEQSFAAGLAEALTQLAEPDSPPVLLVASDVPLPQPLDALHATGSGFGCALVLDRADAAGPSLARIKVTPADAAPSPPPDVVPIELARNPAARALPLLQALARGAGAVIEFQPGFALAIEVAR